jgi:ATP/maltotriose-dependent transcriptional regulator MalT
LGGIKRVAGTSAGSIVALLLALGFGSNDISKVISPRTVKPHTLNIYQKLDVNGRLQAVDKASELGILA